jgi:hypothetical protein
VERAFNLALRDAIGQKCSEKPYRTGAFAGMSNEAQMNVLLGPQ